MRWPDRVLLLLPTRRLCCWQRLCTWDAEALSLANPGAMDTYSVLEFAKAVTHSIGLVAAGSLQDRLPVGASALRVAYPDGCSVIRDL